MSLRAIAKFGALLLGVFAIALALRVAWTHFNVPQQLASSSVARWWRCQNVEHPKLALGRERWTLTYSWSGGFGPGGVTFVLNSDGSAILRSFRYDELLRRPSISEYNVSDEQIARIARVIDQNGLLCQAVYPRDGYIVWDLGRFSVNVSTGDFSRAVFVDECHTIADPRALGELQRALISMSPSLPESIAWGPYGTATVPAGICADREPTQSGILKAAPPHRPP